MANLSNEVRSHFCFLQPRGGSLNSFLLGQIFLPGSAGNETNPAAMGREPALVIDGVEIAEQHAGLGVGRGGWRVEPGERGRVAGAPARELQGDRRQIGLEYLRRREWRQ